MKYLLTVLWRRGRGGRGERRGREAGEPLRNACNRTRLAPVTPVGLVDGRTGRPVRAGLKA